MPARPPYVETFRAGDAGGWEDRARPLELVPGSSRGSTAVRSAAPWWIDANHAPHYMNLPFCLWTAAVDERDLRNARITLRLRGVGFDGKGAALKLLVQ